MALGWRDHGLYHKVMGEPYVFSSEVTGKDKNMYALGRKDFWMESYAHALEDRLTKEELHEAQVQQKRREDRIFALTYARRQRMFGQKDYVRGPSEPERQQAFKASLKQHSDRKYIVREDLADMTISDSESAMQDNGLRIDCKC